jgi:hypothetical protein
MTWASHWPLEEPGERRGDPARHSAEPQFREDARGIGPESRTYCWFGNHSERFSASCLLPVIYHLNFFPGSYQETRTCGPCRPPSPENPPSDPGFAGLPQHGQAYLHTRRLSGPAGTVQSETGTYQSVGEHITMMKRLGVLAVLSLGTALAAPPSAWAWSNFHFSIGLDISYQSANNCFLWGLFRNGPAGYETPLPAWGFCASCINPGCYGYGALPGYVDYAAPVAASAQGVWTGPMPTAEPQGQKSSAPKSSSAPGAGSSDASTGPTGSVLPGSYLPGSYLVPASWWPMGPGSVVPSYWYGW